jgi:FtsH-binding integral membrane protein
MVSVHSRLRIIIIITIIITIIIIMPRLDTVISTTGALILAFVNVKLLQIDQHRAWIVQRYGALWHV